MTELRDIQHILVIRRDNIGDLICTTPLLHALRQRFPEARLDVLANSYNAPILTGNPDINEVIAYTKAKHDQAPKLLSLWREWRVYRGLKAKAYDLVIHANPTNHPRTEKLVRYLKPRHALGVSESDNSVYDLRLAFQDISGVHHVQRVFSLLKPLGIESEPGPLFVQGRHDSQPQTPPRLGIHISSRRPCNRWPLEHFAQVIKASIAKDWACRLMWAPGAENDPLHPGDDGLACELSDRFGSQLETCPTTNLDELRTSLAQTDMVLCCDGGALHVAAGLGRPTVALFGCTDPAMWGPWGVRSQTLNGEGQASNISVADALQGLNGLLETQTS